MQFITTNIGLSNSFPNNQIETPIKKSKKQHSDDLNTAESIVLTDQKPSSLNDIDAQELFERFHDIVKISEVQQEQEYQFPSQTVYRKLDYLQSDKKIKKLDFSPSDSSMKKKNKIHNGKTLSGKVEGKQLFEVIQINSPKKNKILLQNEVRSAQVDQKIVFTPNKKAKQNKFCQMTAKKESPYRDLNRKL